MSEKQWFIPKVPKLSDTLRTYEQGRADGRKEMAEAACMAVCGLCNSGGMASAHSRTCHDIRRAAKELGVAL